MTLVIVLYFSWLLAITVTVTLIVVAPRLRFWRTRRDIRKLPEPSRAEVHW